MKEKLMTSHRMGNQIKIQTKLLLDRFRKIIEAEGAKEDIITVQIIHLKKAFNLYQSLLSLENQYLISDLVTHLKSLRNKIFYPAMSKMIKKNVDEILHRLIDAANFF